MDLLKSVFRIDLKKGIVGSVIALVVFVAGCIWFDWRKGLIYAAVFAILGFLRLDFKVKAINAIVNVLWLNFVITTVWYTSYTSTVTLSDISKSTDKMFLNCLCIAIIFTLALTVTAKWKASVVISSALLCLLATASGFINQFRGKELCPVDFLSWGTALDVAEHYTPKINAETFWGWVLCLAVVFATFTLPHMVKLHKLWIRVAAAAATVILILSMYHGARDVKIQSWGDFGSRFNGFYLNFALGIRDLSFNKPDDYSIQAIKQYEQTYLPLEEENPIPPTEIVDESVVYEPADIIVIMDESYGDFRVFGSELNTNIPVTPFIDSLYENTVRGYALASVFGGNTANSEFEFLTGCSLAFMPQNAIPYQQYIKGKLSTLAWCLNDCGYTSTATHPCPSGNWSRGRIYPYFGFSGNTFEDDYPNAERVREFVSDRAVFEHILSKLGSDTRTEPRFVFAVTMQNHSSYNYEGDNYSKTVELEGYSRDYPAAEQYLSLINETDKAVEYLINELSAYERKTVVVFFGDHLPAVENEFYKELLGGEFDTLEKQMIQYKVPFFIWANYDIEEKYVDCTALSYLSTYLLEVADIVPTPFHDFLKQMEETVPAMNSLGYYSKEQGKFIPHEEARGIEAEMLTKYSNLQYNNIFDTKNRSDIFFDNFISVVEK